MFRDEFVIPTNAQMKAGAVAPELGERRSFSIQALDRHHPGGFCVTEQRTSHARICAAIRWACCPSGRNSTLRRSCRCGQRGEYRTLRWE